MHVFKIPLYIICHYNKMVYLFGEVKNAEAEYKFKSIEIKYFLLRQEVIFSFKSSSMY